MEGDFQANIFVNPRGNASDFALPPASGRIGNNRAEYTSTGDASAIVGQGTNPALQAVEAEWRGWPCETIQVVNPGTTGIVSMRQRIPRGRVFGNNQVNIRYYGWGPAGATFQFGLDGQRSGRFIFEGPDVVSKFEETFSARTSDQEFLSIEYFVAPSMAGMYGRSYVQVQPWHNAEKLRPVQDRSPIMERMLMNYLSFPLTRGIQGFLAPDGSFRACVRFPSPMRVSPTPRQMAFSGIQLKSLVDNSVITGGAAQLLTDYRDEDCAHIRISGFGSVVSVLTPYMLLTPKVGVMDAGY